MHTYREPGGAWLVLEGTSPEASVIQGALNEDGEAVGWVVTVNRSAELVLGNLTIARGGVLAKHAKVRVLDCGFRNNLVAVSVDSSETLITGCVIEPAPDWPAILAVQGILSVFQTEIVDTGSGPSGVGILAELGATALVEFCEIDGRRAALSARRGSFMEVVDLATSSSMWAVEALEDSYVSVRSSVLSGAAKVNRSSTVSLVSVDLAGDVIAHTFGRLIVENSQISGSLFCDPTSDAQCFESSFFGSSFCDNCQSEQ